MGHLENTMKGQGETVGEASFKYQAEKIITIPNHMQSVLYL